MLNYNFVALMILESFIFELGIYGLESVGIVKPIGLYGIQEWMGGWLHMAPI